MYSPGRIRLETSVLGALERRGATPNELAKELGKVPHRLLKVVHYLEAVGLIRKISTPFFEGTIYEREINTRYMLHKAGNVGE